MAKPTGLIVHTHRCGGGCGKQSLTCRESKCRYSEWIVCPECVARDIKIFMQEVESEKVEFNLTGQSFEYSLLMSAIGKQSIESVSEKSKMSVDYIKALENCKERNIEPLPKDVFTIAIALEVPIETFYQQSSLF